MAEIKDIIVPDIGDFEGVEVIEIIVTAGDSINVEDPIVSLESDKAAMEIPSPFAGTVKEVKVSIGDKVSQGDLLITIEASDAGASEESRIEDAIPAAEEAVPAAETPAEAKPAPAPTPAPTTPARRPSPPASMTIDEA